MKQAIKIATDDGEVFDTYRQAEQHVKLQHADAMSRLCHSLMNKTTYKTMAEHITVNLDDLYDKVREAYNTREELRRGLEKLEELDDE